jgi:hypothetical protein
MIEDRRCWKLNRSGNSWYQCRLDRNLCVVEEDDLVTLPVRIVFFMRWRHDEVRLHATYSRLTRDCVPAPHFQQQHHRPLLSTDVQHDHHEVRVNCIGMLLSGASRMWQVDFC